MHSAGPNSGAKGPLNVSAAGPRFGPAKPAAAAIRDLLALAVLSALLLIAPRPAQAQTETVLYNFFTAPNDGAYPYSGPPLTVQATSMGRTTPTVWLHALTYSLKK